MTQETGSAILVDLLAQIIVEVADKTPQTFGSFPGAWHTTTEPRIVVMFNASDSLSIDQVQPEDVDPFLSIAMSQMFLEYRLDIEVKGNDIYSPHVNMYLSHGIICV